VDISRISIGANPPHEVSVIIEIPQGGAPVKYEFDKASGAMFVDRFLHTAMFYPANYGFIPHTLSEDGDPIDCMVIAPTPVTSGVIVRTRPIGALLMEDEKGIDEKIIGVPIDKLHPYYTRRGKLSGPAGDSSGTDWPFLRALQGAGKRQMGEAAALGGAHRSN
jgi:inorganic pyrophosphatase